jgi:hypothetical protein
MDELLELLELQAETARDDERFSVLDTVREVFGYDVEVIEFIPYDNEGTTTTRRAN